MRIYRASGQQALVLQFGNPVHAVSEPGLHFKLPIQNVEYYERRILELDPPVQQVLLSDQKRVNVDSFARWRIIDPLTFRQRATNSRQLCAAVWSASELGHPW